MARLNCGEGIPNFYAQNVTKNAKCPSDWSDSVFDPVKKLFGDCVSIESYNYKKDENGLPLISECNKLSFVKYYSSAEGQAIFDSLYSNNFGLQDNFIAFWDAVSKKFSKNQFVIGFDPINEPFPALNSKNDLVPGAFDKYQLQPMYEKVFEKYKKNDDEVIMYFETGQFPDAYLGVVNKAGFDSPPGAKNGSANHVLNDHTYCCQLGPEICATGEPALNKSKECQDWHHKRISTRADDAKALGIPLIVSEFGACYGSDICAREITQVADECDDALAGWAYWQFKYYKDLTTTAGTGSEGFYNQDGSL